MDFIPGLKATSDALTAHKQELDLIASNIANAQTTRDANGLPYKRKVAVFESYMPQDNVSGENKTNQIQSVRISSIMEDNTPGLKIYDPTHPHADSEGMVEQSNVKVSNEMVDLIETSHAYEANLTVVRTSRQIAQQIMQIGK